MTRYQLGLKPSPGTYYRHEPPHGKVEHKPITGTHPWSRLLATCDEHECTITWRGDVYDHVAVHGSFHVGKARSDAEAVSLWKNHLISIGVHAENTKEVEDR